MKSSVFTSIRFIMALLTVAALAGKSFIPPKTLLIHPAPGTWTAIYGPTDAGAGPAAQWINEQHNEWLCDYRSLYGHVNCGVSFTWGGVAGSGISGSAYPECERADSDETGDGWGWENEQSCIVGPASRGERLTAVNTSWSTPVYCSDGIAEIDEDGWGWDSGQRCIIAQVDQEPHSQVSSDQTPSCADAAFAPNGGRWGWESEHSCIPELSAAPQYDTPPNPSSVIDTLNSIDFSGYDGINVSIHYEGRANFLRLYLRNYNPEYSDSRDLSSSKFMSAFLRTEDLKAGPAYVSLKEFSVEEWWTLDNDLPRALTAPEFDRIVNLGVDHIEHGMHRMRVERIELVGTRISTENFLIFILLIWVTYLSFEGAFHYYHLRSASRHRALQIDQLNSQAQLLEQEKQLLQTRSFTDPLTKIFNRSGLEHSLDRMRSGTDGAARLGLMVMDIDHFKKANDTFGHDWGDQVLKLFAHLIQSNTREDDIFARWGGEEFVLITRHASHKSLIAMAEKLRVKVSEQKFNGSDDTRVTISIGLTTLNEWEDFGAAFKRADRALYQAKVQRNCVVYEG